MFENKFLTQKGSKSDQPDKCYVLYLDKSWAYTSRTYFSNLFDGPKIVKHSFNNYAPMLR